ncbi:MAG: 4Fe-4S cluster-binding domain-containing protein, partial [Neisseria sp.]
MSSLKFTVEQIVWQEVPGEVSLAFLFSGCPLRCKGCHSADTWKEGIGT